MISHDYIFDLLLIFYVIITIARPHENPSLRIIYQFFSLIDNFLFVFSSFHSLFEGPVCGNSFVEDGEECDCGLPEKCTNNCCDPVTCKLRGNATCATGACCDLQVVDSINHQLITVTFALIFLIVFLSNTTEKESDGKTFMSSHSFFKSEKEKQE